MLVLLIHVVYTSKLPQVVLLSRLLRVVVMFTLQVGIKSIIARVDDDITR